MQKIFDSEAEEVFLRSILYHVEFSDLYEHISPAMLYGEVKGSDWSPIAGRYLYEVIRNLYIELRNFPHKDSVRNRILTNKSPISGIKESDILSYVDRLYNKGKTSSIEAKDSRIRIFKSYQYRLAASLIEQAAEDMKNKSGDEVLDFLHKNSIIQAEATSDYEITDYFSTRQNRMKRIRSIQEGIDPKVLKIPFGIRGLDIETGGGMAPGELIIGAAAVGRGKTIFMQDSCAYNVERNNGCVFFTKEMNANEIGLRFDSRFTGIPHPRFYDSIINEKEFTVWEDKLSHINGPLRIVAIKRDFSISRCRDILNSLDWTFDVRVAYFDYINIMEPSDQKFKGRSAHEIGMIVCEEMKDLLQERGHPAVTMCQLKPQSKDKLKVSYDDFALAKLAPSAFGNVVFAILSDDWLEAAGRGILQILKIRAKKPNQTMYDMFPVHDSIRIDTNVRGVPNHPAPKMAQQFYTVQPAETEFDHEQIKKDSIVVIDQNGIPVKDDKVFIDSSGQ